MHGSQRPGTAASDITPREREILTLLARGLSNVAIGQRLYISSATVKFHVGNLRPSSARAAAEAVYAARDERYAARARDLSVREKLERASSA